MAGTDIERMSLAPDILNEREARALQWQAQRMANTKLVPKALQGKPDDVLLVMLTAREIGMHPMAAVGGALYPIDGKVAQSAQTMIALAERAGHEVWPIERSATRCIVGGCRRGSKRDVQVTYELEEARKAGLLDRWAERWVDNHPERVVVGNDQGIDQDKVAKAPEWAKKKVAAGDVKSKDNWAKYPSDMLFARAVSRLCRTAFSDALLGLEPFTPEELGAEEDAGYDLEPQTYDEEHRPRDDDVVEAEVPDAEAEPSQEQKDAVDADVVEETADSQPAPRPSDGPGDGGPGLGEVTGPADRRTEEAGEENSYARAIHILASELGLSDEALDACIHDVTNEVSANSITRENWGQVVDLMRKKAGKAA